ncbi:hypothetical protein [Streptomyces sp. NPDC057854]|uniref:hypothetical protein n=1 Tax=unclassified Streptomyces TaxID=2593676 RepID=UPI0036D1E550
MERPYAAHRSLAPPMSSPSCGLDEVLDNLAAKFTKVHATAHGTYEGREVHWQQTYESECDLILATGRVFTF